MSRLIGSQIPKQRNAREERHDPWKIDNIHYNYTEKQATTILKKVDIVILPSVEIMTTMFLQYPGNRHFYFTTLG